MGKECFFSTSDSGPSISSQAGPHFTSHQSQLKTKVIKVTEGNTGVNHNKQHK